MAMTGGCLCGAVRFVAHDVPETYGICHCEMCRRWTGAALAEVSVPTDKITWEGEAHIGIHKTSDWAERAWCTQCGSTLYFRHTRPDKWFGSTDIALGLFDDPHAFRLGHEIFTDQACVKTADIGQKRLSRADVLAINPDLEEAG